MFFHCFFLLFNLVYRKRREYLGDIANNYRAGCETPTIEYTKEEIETWGTVYKYLDGFHKKHACKEYLAVKEKLELACGYGVDRIPQVADISKFLMVSCIQRVHVMNCLGIKYPLLKQVNMFIGLTYQC